jgi:hypothetical protein
MAFRRCRCPRRRAPPLTRRRGPCSRRCPWRLAPRSSAPASPRARSSTALRPSSPNGAARQRARLLLPLRARGRAVVDENPNGGGWSCLLPEQLSSSFESTPRGFGLERSTVPSARRRLGPGGGRGDARPASDSWGEGAAGSFPFFPRSPLGPRAHAGLGVRASRSARPRAHPARADAAGPAARPPGSAAWLDWSKR